MATKTTKYGRTMTFKLANVQIENLRGKGLSQSRDTRETTTTDSSDDEESVPTIKRRTIPFDGLISDGATSNAATLLCRDIMKMVLRLHLSRQDQTEATESGVVQATLPNLISICLMMVM